MIVELGLLILYIYRYIWLNIIATSSDLVQKGVLLREVSRKKLQIWFGFSSKLSRFVYAYTLDHLNIESLNGGLVAVDDILLKAF